MTGEVNFPEWTAALYRLAGALEDIRDVLMVQCSEKELQELRELHEKELQELRELFRSQD